MKKKNGSAIVAVLGMTIVVLALSGVLLKFTMNTMKANTRQKESEDVQYAAESGLELGKSQVEKIANLTLPAGTTPNYEFNTETSGSPQGNLATPLEQGKIANVAIKSTAVGSDKVIIESTATDVDGKEKTIKCKFEIYQNNQNDIFNYGIVGGQGLVNIENSGGGKNNISSLVSSTSIEDENGNPVNNITPNENGTKPTVEKNRFGDLTFLTNQPQSNKIKAQYSGSPRISLSDATFIADGSIVNPTVIEADIKDPSKITVKNGSDIKEFKTNVLGNKNNIPVGFEIKNVIIMNVNGIGAKGKIEILLTNTKHLELETLDISLDVIDSVILNKGTIEFLGTGSVKLTNSTVYGEDIKANLKLGFHVTDSLKTTLGIGDKDKNEKNLNELLEAILPGWNKVTNSSASGINEIKGSYDSEK